MATTYQTQYDALLARLQAERVPQTDAEIEAYMVLNNEVLYRDELIVEGYSRELQKAININKWKARRSDNEARLIQIQVLIAQNEV